jgi:hypothetical protein
VRRLGAIALIDKPVNRDELIEVIDRCLHVEMSEAG